MTGCYSARASRRTKYSRLRGTVSVILLFPGVAGFACNLPLAQPRPTNTPIPSPSASAVVTRPAAPTTTPRPPPAHRIGVRVVNGVGEFYDRMTGEKFVPRGNNYIRLGPQTDPFGQRVIYHSTFDPGSYDPARVETAFKRMHADGYNMVRVFLSQNTIIDRTGQLHPAYIVNVLDFLQKAKTNGLYVMFTQDWLPAGKYGDILNQECCDVFNFNNVHYLSSSGLRANQVFFQDFIRALIGAGAPLDAVFAYELRNELFFDTNYPPLSLASGTVRTANGQTYDMSKLQDKKRVIEENLPYWIGHMRTAILEVDPTALVGVGFFQPQEPNPTRLGDPRLVSTRPAIWESQADFIDLHLYPGLDLNLKQYVQNFQMEGMQEKPIIMGEFGAFRSAYPSASAAAQALQEWQVASCQYGFDGWLLWTWDAVEQTDFYNALSGDGEINSVLAPAKRPDPCLPDTTIPRNVALNAKVTASRSLPDQPPAQAVDGLANTIWGAGDFPPQWIRIDLGGPRTIIEIRLNVSQYPAGETTHRVWGSRPNGTEQLLHEFKSDTDDLQWLMYKPPQPWKGIQFVRVETVASPSWVGWREIQIFAGSGA